jgi:hypothetical protein
MEYTNRYFAFVDILGFSNLIRQSERGAIDVKAVHDLLKVVHKPPTKARLWDHGIQTQSISDAVAISTKSNDEGLETILWALKSLSFKLLDMGYFVRGGLVRGALFHQQNTVFGPAFLDAYHLESAVAKFPRIMINRAVMDDIRNSLKNSRLEKFVSQSSDGPYAVNIMEGLDASTSDGYRKVMQPRLEKIASQIKKRLDEANHLVNHLVGISSKVRPRDILAPRPWLVTVWREPPAAAGCAS